VRKCALKGPWRRRRRGGGGLTHATFFSHPRKGRAFSAGVSDMISRFTSMFFLLPGAKNVLTFSSPACSLSLRLAGSLTANWGTHVTYSQNEKERARTSHGRKGEQHAREKHTPHVRQG